jgi:hypothetical protein
MEAMFVSSVVIGGGCDSVGDLNLIVWSLKENEMADRSRARCVSRTERSLLLSSSTPTDSANVEANSSWEKMRDVLDVAVLDASSRTAFAAAYNLSVWLYVN